MAFLVFHTTSVILVISLELCQTAEADLNLEQFCSGECGSQIRATIGKVAKVWGFPFCWLLENLCANFAMVDHLLCLFLLCRHRLDAGASTAGALVGATGPTTVNPLG